MKTICREKELNDREIVFVVDYMKPRIAKIGWALRKKQYKVILFLNKENKATLKYFPVFYDKVISFKESDVKGLFRRCRSFKPLVYHIFNEANVKEWAYYLIQNKNQLGKIIFDQYDVYRGFVTEVIDLIAKREKYCLEQADGLCCRMFETQHLKKSYGYRFKKRILFLDYCWNQYSHVVDDDDSQELRFVYGGRLIPRSLGPGAILNRYKIERSGFRYLAKTIQEAGGSFSIISSVPCEKAAYSAYRNISSSFDRTQIKEPMSFNRLIRFESEMDYGIDCVELQQDIEKYHSSRRTFHVKRKNWYYATNKFFDYLDAGVMPIYGREYEIFGRCLARYGGAIFCSLEEMPYKMNELKNNRKENKRKAQSARDYFAIENHIDRLISFYHEV